MDSESKHSNYHSPLRVRQKEQTRELILCAIHTILSKSDLSAVSIGEVAKTAEVTERTVYRHFASREELLRSFWKWQLERSGGGKVLGPASLPELYETIKRLFESLDTDEGVIRAILSAPEGREMRTEANQRRLAMMIDFIAPMVPGLPETERHSMASGIISVCSVLSWLFMRDNCGYDGKRAGEAAAFAVQLMIEGGKLHSRNQLGQQVD